MKNIIKNFIEVINIIVFEWLKTLTINLWEVIINIIFTILTYTLNLAFDILYLLNPSFYTTNETEEEEIENKNKIGFQR